MHSIRIVGAGSIGNHLANAARTRGWNVVLTDIDPKALERARNEIYPSRYGAWDPAIVLKDSREAAGDPADVIFIGTPPDSHISLALDTLKRTQTKVLLIEKPLAGPNLAQCDALLTAVKQAGIFCAVGYNHCLGKNTKLTEKLMADKRMGRVISITAQTREHWQGIFNAHPWLSGPSDSYLGFSARGGGSLGEHSHALNIWQHFARLCGAGRVAEVSATVDRVTDGGVDYDQLAFVTLKTETGLIGDVIQDVITSPADKSARIQGEHGFIEWKVNAAPGQDMVKTGLQGAKPEETMISKTRADDFLAEIDHLADVMAGKVQSSPISLERGLDTMMVIAAAFKSHELGRRVRIDWARGYTPAAIL